MKQSSGGGNGHRKEETVIRGGSHQGKEGREREEVGGFIYTNMQQENLRYHRCVHLALPWFI